MLINQKNIISSILLFFYENKVNTLVLNDFKKINYSKELILDTLSILIRLKIITYKNKTYKLVNTKFYNTILSINKEGNGYLKNDFGNDFFIDKASIINYLPNDKLIIYKYSKNNKEKCFIVKMLSDKNRIYYGTALNYKNKKHISVDNNFKFLIEIFDRKIKVNDRVKVQIIKYNAKENKIPLGKVLEVYGNSIKYDTEIQIILSKNEINSTFSEQIINESKNINSIITETEISKRLDFRNKSTFTIDPDDAKDFDDAISVNFISENKVEVGVHIADVSHYVSKNSEIDKEAFKRGNSIYLVDKVIPMLPKNLSNELCSLKPNEDKLTFSVIFLFENSILKEHKICKTIIHSDNRFTYDEAQTVLDNKKGILYKELDYLNRLAKQIKKERINNGSILFNKIEPKFILDKENNPIDIKFKIAKEVNFLIEEFMLLSNRKIAEYFIEKNKPSIYRVHNKPDAIKLLELQKIIKQFGYSIDTNIKDNALQKSINKLLKQIKNKPEENLIDTLVIKTMSKAIYNTKNEGHYGLSFQNYTHFTSPIRRYSDLIIHRMLSNINYSYSNLNIIAESCTNSEDIAVKTERESIKYMQVKYISKFKNDIMPGIITGITEWGIYVEVIENKCEGLIRIKDLKNDYFYLDEKKYTFVGKETNKKYRLGDKVDVKLKKYSLDKKTIDFTLVE